MFEGMEIKVFPDTNINDYIKMINDEGFDAFYQKGKIIVGEQIKSDLAINLSKARRKAGLSRKELADKLQLSYTSIKDFENGTRMPGKYSMQIINKFLGGQKKMKYYCENCKTVLDEDDLEKYEEPSEAWGHTVYEPWWVCPNCGHVPVEYENQDKTCQVCVLYETDACPYGGKHFKVCGDFIGEGE